MSDADFRGLSKIKIAASNENRLKWSEGMSFTVPDEIAQALKVYSDNDGSIRIPENLKLTPVSINHSEYRLKRAYCHEKPFQSSTPFSYQRIPSFIRDFVAKTMGKNRLKHKNKWARYPDWPLDLSCDFLSDLFCQEDAKSIPGKTPVILSHDLDTAEGLANCVKYFLPLEEKYGFHSVNYIVAKGWEIDHRLLTELRDRGHEVGVHGYDHSNKTAFMSAQEREKRISEFKPLIDRYGVTGYRSPSLLSTPGLLDNLSKYFRYDSSIPSSGGLFPVPNYGCASARPFRIGNILEIPLSLPRDGSMVFLGFRPDQIADIWIDSSRSIAASGGAVVLLTHCEKRFSGNTPMLEAYEKYLQHVSSDDTYQVYKAEEILKLYQ
ncbi:MAG: polysaccharide deacetylase family protein [Candidatus Omnitrophica bacterium]|nr:polysaccharide deacetylase family protein [Candidatus Omnitrophota bacterium]